MADETADSCFADVELSHQWCAAVVQTLAVIHCQRIALALLREMAESHSEMA